MNVNDRPTLRDEQAEVTRRRITGAARTLFGARGYGATTLQAIAVEARVAVQTVYAIYRSKAGILRALSMAVAVQPEADALYREAVAAQPAGRKLELFSQSIRRRWDFGSDVVRFNREAASTDPAVRSDVEEILARRRGGIERLSATLAGDLPSGMDVAGATALLVALSMPEVYAELTGVFGWTPDEYEAWLARSLKNQLLRV